MDAGLPSAFDLTERVYDQLGSGGKSEQALFGYVIAKLLVRQSRQGVSPFRKLNIEDVYDALKRFISRDTDILGEFVYSWDPITAPSASSFDPQRFAQLLGSSFSLRQRFERTSISGNNDRLQAAAELISRALQPVRVEGEIHQALRPYLEILAKCLSPVEEKHGYLDKISEYAERHSIAIASLNYDTLIERSCSSRGAGFDYGLSRWNERKYIRFTGSGLKLIKLHGSINWYESNDNILIDPQNAYYMKRAIIFGGQNDKLVPHGPYLQLRHEFQRLLRGTNILGIIGYSFQDVHLNAVIRAWVSCKVKAKIVIMDPGIPRISHDVVGNGRKDKAGKIGYSVEFDHIKKRASEGMDDFIASLSRAPNPKSSN